jgi:hypothetical protein
VHAEVHVAYPRDFIEGPTQKGGDRLIVRQDIQALLDKEKLA